MSTMTPAALMNALFVDFSAWALPLKGRVWVARDLEHAMTLLGDTPSGWTAVLHWQGDDPAGSVRRGNVVENNLRVFIRTNLGPTAVPDLALIRTTAARPSPLLDLVADVRARMLCYTFPGVPAPGNRMAYKGASDQTAVGNVLVAVYSLLFSVWTTFEMPAEGDLVALGV